MKSRTPIRFLATTILKEWTVAVETLHQAYQQALAGPAEKSVMRDVYDSIWPILSLYLFHLEEPMTVNELDIVFEKLKKQLPGYHPSYESLAANDKILLHALIDFYKPLAMHRHILTRLIALGGEFQATERTSSFEEMEAQTRLNQAQEMEQQWTTKLALGIKGLLNNVETLVKNSSPVSAYRAKLEVADEVFLSSQRVKTRQLTQAIETLKQEYEQLNERIQLHLETVETIRSEQIHSGWTTLAMRCDRNCIELATLATLKEAIKAQQMTTQLQEKKLNEQANQLRQEAEGLTTRWLKEQKETSVAIRAYLQGLRQPSNDKFSEAIVGEAMLDGIPPVQAVEVIAKKFHEQMVAFNALTTVLLSVREKILSVGDQLTIVYAIRNLMELKALDEKKESPLVTILDIQLTALQQLLKACDQQYTDLYFNRLSPQQKNNITQWTDVQKLTKQIHNDIVTRMQALREAISYCNMNAECNALRESMEQQASGVSAMLDQLARKRTIFSEHLQRFHQAKQAMLKAMQAQHQNQLQAAIHLRQYRRQENIAAFERLKTDVERFKPTLLNLPKERVVLQHLPAEQYCLQRFALLQEKYPVNQETFPEETFLHQHAIKIASSTFVSGCVFGAAGLGIALLFAPITFGLALPLFSAIFFTVGCVVGLAANAVMGILKKKRSSVEIAITPVKESTSVIQQELAVSPTPNVKEWIEEPIPEPLPFTPILPRANNVIAASPAFRRK